MADSPKSRAAELLRAAGETRFALDVLHVFSLTAVAVAYPLYAFLQANPAYFVTQRLEPSTILTFITLLSVGLPAVFAVMPRLIGRVHTGAGNVAKVLVIMLLSGLAFAPATRHLPGYFLGLAPDWTAFVSSVVIGLVLAYQYFTNKFLNTLLLLITPMILVVPGRLLLDSDMRQILQSDAEHMVDVEPLTPETTPPIVFVVFDELPLVSLLDAEGEIDARRYPNFARLAENATWFSRATTVHDYTLKAVPAILTGRLPITGPILPLLANYPTSIFHLLGESYDVNARELATNLNAGGDETDTTRASLFSFSMDLAAMYAHTILPEDTANAWAPMDDNLWGGFFVQQGAGQKGVPANAHQWLKDRLGADGEGDRPAQFRDFIESISEHESTTLHVLHVNLPHRPFAHLPSGRVYNVNDWMNASLDSGDKTRYRHQLRHAHLLQAGLADTLLGELIDALRADGSYDETLIVVVADHGMYFGDIEHDRELTEENFVDIAYVPLIIKYPNQSGAVVDSSNVQTVDIVPTLLDALGCENVPRMDGRSLLDDNAPVPETKFIMNRVDEVFRVPATEADEEFGSAVGEFAREFHLDNPKTNIYQYGPRLDALGLDESDVAPRAVSADIVINNVAALQQPQTVASLNALVSGSVTLGATTAAEDVQVLVALNGKIAVQTPLLKIGDELRFYTVIPEDLILPNRNTVTALVLPDAPLD